MVLLGERLPLPPGQRQANLERAPAGPRSMGPIDRIASPGYVVRVAHDRVLAHCPTDVAGAEYTWVRCRAAVLAKEVAGSLNAHQKPPVNKDAGTPYSDPAPRRPKRLSGAQVRRQTWDANCAGWVPARA